MVSTFEHIVVIIAIHYPSSILHWRCRHQVDRLLQDVGCCVWVLDFTKLKTEEERCLLAKLRDMNPQLMERLSQRLFFVVNKVRTSVAYADFPA